MILCCTCYLPSRCGDGVIGRANPFRNNAGVDAAGNPTGALAFLIDAVMNRGITRIGLLGYSHGGGSIDLLMEALADRASRDGNLFDRLVSQDRRFFWTAYIDAININLTVQFGGQYEATGTQFPETHLPIRNIPNSDSAIGSLLHYNAYQQWTILPWRDGVPLGGTAMDADEWADGWHRNPEYLRQDYAESSNLWVFGPKGRTTHRAPGAESQKTSQFKLG